MSLTPEQKMAAHAPCSLVVTAGAGTGKTHMLAERYLYYLKQINLSPLEIVAVTFTEKAAAELKARIRALVSRELPERFDLLAQLEAAPISTIHALASRICREHFSEITIHPDFTVIDDLEGQIWLNEKLKEALTKLSPKLFKVIPYSALGEIITNLLADSYTANLALQRGIQNWDELIIQARLTGLKTLVNDRIWQEVWLTLHQYRGESGDKLEVLRQAVIGAMENLEEVENIDKAISVIDKINLRAGSPKNWQADGFKKVKSSLTALRDLVRNSQTQELINLELTETDEKLKIMLPAIAEAYREVSLYLHRLKQEAKVLSFSDLEIYALQALKQKEVKEYYQKRWQVLLVDEFQDTNPAQGELIELLSESAELTIVGDIKQSIYGFRRADIAVFQRFRDRILQQGGKEVILDRSFRTHQALIEQINAIFSPLLADKHQNLVAARETAPSTEINSLQTLAIIDRDKISSKEQRQRVEAYCLAQRLKTMLDDRVPVYDKQTRVLRPLQPQDMAILTRTWQPLTVYEAALAAVGIPVAPSGGGNLLDTREAKDAIAILRFLAEPRDDIALVAVLRSPFFTISDRLLFEISSDKESTNWWQRIKQAKLSQLKQPITVLQELLARRYEETPSRLLQIVDRLTGYTAVIANLPGAQRRLADWQGSIDLVQNLQQGTNDIFGVVRRLKRLEDNEVAVSRPIVAAENAVSLMTIFAAKGLEWSVVVLADLNREPRRSTPPVYFDPQWGIAVKTTDTTDNEQKPALYTWLEYRQQQRETEEAIRVLYVALTRARDYLFLTASDSQKGDLDRLKPGLETANISIDIISFAPNLALPLIPQLPAIPQILPPLLLNSFGFGLSELPVTALTEYARCPQRFYLNFILGHPGIGEGIATGMQVGTLVHQALEYNITEVDSLLNFAESSWSRDVVSEAIELAQKFYRQPIYKHFRETATAKECQINLQIGSISFNGVVDLVGDNWVLDYKSDLFISPQEHRWQLWAYAKSLDYPTAHIAYLRHDLVHTFTQEELSNIERSAVNLVENIENGNYSATPKMEKCAVCPYLAFCDFALF
jgi:ATP-dependent helicase/nuclease subunit A